MVGVPEIAISVRQPWAWAIVHGGKDIENRIRAPAGTARLIGQGVAIHAARGMTQQEYYVARDFMASIGVECPLPAGLYRGGIIGHATLGAVVTQSESAWFFGPSGLCLSEPVEVHPVPAVGQLGWFKWVEGGAFDAPKPWMRSGRAIGRHQPRYTVSDVAAADEPLLDLMLTPSPQTPLPLGGEGLHDEKGGA